MMDEASIMVPNLDVGKKLISACNEVMALEGTKDFNSLGEYENISLPPEFSQKLNFDINGRSQFERHPLAHYSNGGLQGFTKRLTKVYTSLVARKIAQGYSGAVIGLWNQDLVYILAELLCYTDDVMAVRVGLALEEMFLREDIVDDNVETLLRRLRLKCPRLCNILEAEDALHNTVLGLYRSCCTTLLARAFAGRPMLPKLWRSCILKQSLLPVVNSLCLLMSRCEGTLVESHRSGKGLKEVDSILTAEVANTSQTDIDSLLTDCFDEMEQIEQMEEVTRQAAGRQGSVSGSGTAWIQLDSTSATILKWCYPISYGLLPEWARQHGPPPHPLVARFLVTGFWCCLFYGLLLFLIGLMHSDGGDASPAVAPTTAAPPGTPTTSPASAGSTGTGLDEHLLAMAITFFVVVMPNVPIVLVYRGMEDAQPLLDEES